jgi:tetratricopeptide (TPR) repeat protein
VADKAMKVTSSQGSYLWMLKSDILMKRGRFEEARAALANTAMAEAPRAFFLSRLGRFQRDYAKAFKDLSKTPPAAQESHSYAFCEGLVARASGDKESAHKWFQLARDRVLPKMSERPMDAQLVMDLAVIDAGLGRKEDALREGEELRRLAPLGRDAVDGPLYAAVHAQILAWVGEPDAALSELEQIVSLPSGPTEAELKADPGWDEVRNDARFAALVARATAPLVVP